MNNGHELLPTLVSSEPGGYNGPVFTFCQKNDYRNAVQLYESDSGIIEKKYGLKKDTFLHIAASYNRSSIVQFLLSKGAVQCKDANGNTPLHIACISGDEATISLLLDKSACAVHNLDGYLPIHIAAAAGNITAVRMLADYGVCCSTPSWLGETPLHAAAQFAQTHVIQFLLNQGVQVADRNNSGETPLHLAAGSKAEDTSHIQILLDAGAYIDCRTGNGSPALFYAAETGTPDSFKLLLDLGSPVRKVRKQGDIYEEETKGETLLRKVLKSGCKEKGKLLIERIMKARIKCNEALNPDDLCRGRKACLTKRNVTTQEMALSSMCTEITDDIEDPDSIFRNLIQANSSILESLLDSCLVCDQNRATMLDKVNYDFFLFHHSSRDMIILELLLETGQVSLFEHPLLETYIELKWIKAWKIFLFFMMIFSFHMATLFGLVLVEHGNVCAKENKEKIRDGFWFSFLVLNSIISFFMGAKTFNFILTRIFYRGSKSRYSYKNIAEVMDRFALVKELIIPVLGFVTIFTSSKEVSSVLILISAYQFMMNMSRIPRVGSHVFITGRVFTTIFEFFCSYIVVILGYAVSFHILLPEEVAFSNLGDSFIKVLTMLLGEFDYVDHIASTESGWMSRVIFSSFLLLMSIVLMNLVVGLAIGDIENMRKDANIYKLISTMACIRLVEELCHFMHKVNCLRFFKSRSLPQTCKFTWEAFLDLKENRGHCSSRSRITVREPSTGLQREYTSSNRVAQKVADIIQKRWKPDLTMSEEWNKVLGKIYSLEQKIQALTTTNYQSSPGTDCKLST